jgi:hypothetical protein
LNELHGGGKIGAFQGQHVIGIDAFGGGNSEIHVGAAHVDDIIVDDIGSLIIDIENFEIEFLEGHVVDFVEIVFVVFNLEFDRS